MPNAWTCQHAYKEATPPYPFEVPSKALSQVLPQKQGLYQDGLGRRGLSLRKHQSAKPYPCLLPKVCFFTPQVSMKARGLEHTTKWREEAINYFHSSLHQPVSGHTCKCQRKSHKSPPSNTHARLEDHDRQSLLKSKPKSRQPATLDHDRVLPNLI